MTLAAVTDNGNGLALEKGKITIFLIKNLVSHDKYLRFKIGLYSLTALRQISDVFASS